MLNVFIHMYIFKYMKCKNQIVKSQSQGQSHIHPELHQLDSTLLLLQSTYPLALQVNCKQTEMFKCCLH